MLKIIDIYIIKKFLGTFLFAIILIISIAVVFDITEQMDEFLEKQAPFKEIVFDYYFNFIPYFANLYSSLILFIAVIFFTSKMASDTEIIAILSNGVSYSRLLLPYLISSLIIAIFSFTLSNFVIPPANKARLAFTEKYLKNPYKNFDRNIHRQIAPNVFLYMESFNVANQIGYKLSIEKFDSSKLKSKFIADYVRWDKNLGKWKAFNYYIRTIDGLNEKIVKGNNIDTALNITPENFSKRENIVETMNFTELNAYIDHQRMLGSSNINTYLIEKYRRMSFPFASFILTLIGVTLSSRKAKGGIGLHIGFGILISFSYLLFMQISSQFAIGGDLNPLLAVWIPNLFFTIIGVGLLTFSQK